LPGPAVLALDHYFSSVVTVAVEPFFTALSFFLANFSHFFHIDGNLLRTIPHDGAKPFLNIKFTPVQVRNFPLG